MPKGSHVRTSMSRVGRVSLRSLEGTGWHGQESQHLSGNAYGRYL